MLPINRISKASRVSMNDDWYLYAGKEHFWMQWRYETLIFLLNRYFSPDQKLLEVGCGEGVLMSQLEGGGYTIDGCDLNESALSRALTVAGKLFLYNIFDKAEEFKTKYDGLILFDIIEHIENDVDFIKAASFSLKKGGLIFINVPAFEFLYSNYDKQIGHVRRYNRGSMISVLKQAGIEPLYVGYWGATLIPAAIARRFYMQMVDQDVIRKGFVPPGAWADFILRRLMEVESIIPLNKLAGTSLMAVARMP